MAYSDPISFEEKIPVAAAFLRLCEGGLGYFDGLIADDRTPLEMRSACLDVLVEKILCEAKMHGINQVIAFTDNPRVIERSKRFKFQENHKKMICLDLSESI